MCLMIFSVVQPISAAHIGDTKITGPNNEPLTNMRVHAGNSIELKAQLYQYWSMGGILTENRWISEIGRELHFNLYKENADGTNGKLVWSNTAKTTRFTQTATTDFLIYEKGNYNLDIIFDDPSQDGYISPEYGTMKPCSASIKIEVVGKHHL